MRCTGRCWAPWALSWARHEPCRLFMRRNAALKQWACQTKSRKTEGRLSACVCRAVVTRAFVSGTRNTLMQKKIISRTCIMTRIMFTWRFTCNFWDFAEVQFWIRGHSFAGNAQRHLYVSRLLSQICKQWIRSDTGAGHRFSVHLLAALNSLCNSEGFARLPHALVEKITRNDHPDEVQAKVVSPVVVGFRSGVDQAEHVLVKVASSVVEDQAVDLTEADNQLEGESQLVVYGNHDGDTVAQWTPAECGDALHAEDERIVGEVTRVRVGVLLPHLAE